MGKHLDSATLAARDAAGQIGGVAGQRGAADRFADRRAKQPEGHPLAMSSGKAYELLTDPGHAHGPSIKNAKVYEALRRKGYSKSKAAAISNAK
jgi:hypothetical protein